MHQAYIQGKRTASANNPIQFEPPGHPNDPNFMLEQHNSFAFSAGGGTGHKRDFIGMPLYDEALFGQDSFLPQLSNIN